IQLMHIEKGSAMDTPYDRGRKAGAYDQTQLVEDGWIDEAKEKLVGQEVASQHLLVEAAKLCLDWQEKLYAEDIDNAIPSQKEYLNGVIDSQRETLNAIINEGGN